MIDSVMILLAFLIVLLLIGFLGVLGCVIYYLLRYIGKKEGIVW